MFRWRLVLHCTSCDHAKVIEEFLRSHGITFTRFDHPAVFTCEESALLPAMPGASTKNLFIYDPRTDTHALVVVGHEKRVDLKALKTMLGWSKITFASPERLKKLLGVEPGSVTILGLMHDTDHAVAVYFDMSIAEAQSLQCHPLVNTATLVISQEGIARFLEATGHTGQVIAVPVRESYEV
ncbi:MAG: prolyl-tRNA synthetase [Candidatus Peregrinibacteria bacterium Greene0416_62]|nr:MAG: prolyl-tRNA synthetase [Candidatus Peregrinibacteria bacterium Greene0416_62]TSC99241.1 MAG: prolyl-tRNA synthetase [Candidatus Peregrinibacteria bacterium Greene1014_49]